MLPKKENICFKARKNDGTISPSAYSGTFKNEEKADQWYNRHGKQCEKDFGIKLVKMKFVKNKWAELYG